jgi:hypothetical protein
MSASDAANDDGRDRWERQARETERAYTLFVAYRDLGMRRSLRRLYARLSGRPNVCRASGYLRRLASRWQWRGRATGWDVARLLQLGANGLLPRRKPPGD